MRRGGRPKCFTESFKHNKSYLLLPTISSSQASEIKICIHPVAVAVTWQYSEVVLVFKMGMKKKRRKKKIICLLGFLTPQLGYLADGSQY